MRTRVLLMLAVTCALVLSACAYIVLPEEEGGPAPAGSKGWGAVVTHVGTNEAGDLRIELAIRNDTGSWSAMQAAKPAVLTTRDGRTTTCDTVWVSTGGHRLAPGFQMRGFTGGTKSEPKVQPLCVECSGAVAAPGSKLSFDYTYYTGEYNYYEPELNKASGRMELSLDQVAEHARYPIATPVSGLVLKPGAQITAINNCVLTLAGVTRSDGRVQLKWQVSNPGEYPTYVHIGNPPVIGDEGIIYGLYESPHLASVPMAGAGKTVEWTTEVAVPPEAQGLYVLLSVESKKQRLFANYAIDLGE